MSRLFKKTLSDGRYLHHLNKKNVEGLGFRVSDIKSNNDIENNLSFPTDARTKEHNIKTF
jgi:hypothetical protein